VFDSDDLEMAYISYIFDLLSPGLFWSMMLLI